MRIRTLVFPAALLVAAASARAVSITYTTQSAVPEYLTVGSNGTIYFIDHGNAKLGRQVPDGTHSATSTPDSAPLGLVGGLDGLVWIAEEVPPRIARYNPRNPIFPFAGFDVPSPPHFIAFGADGNLWFTESDVNKIARMTPAGVVTEFSAGISASAGLFKMALGPDGAVWFTESTSAHVGRIATNGAVNEFATAGATEGVTAGPDGNIWFTEEAAGKIGRIERSGSLTEFPVGAGHFPFSITAGPDGNLWFTDTTLNIGRITPAGVVKLFPVDGAHGTPIDIVTGPDGELWFGTSGGELGRVSFSGDVNGDGIVDVVDVFALINYLFAGGPAPS